MWVLGPRLIKCPYCGAIVPDSEWTKHYDECPKRKELLEKVRRVKPEEIKRHVLGEEFVKFMEEVWGLCKKYVQKPESLTYWQAIDILESACALVYSLFGARPEQVSGDPRLWALFYASTLMARTQSLLTLLIEGLRAEETRPK